MSFLDTPPRVASWLLPRVWSYLPVQDRRLFLTFDDGPSEATPDVLSVLQNAGAHASFFLLDSQLALFPEMPGAYASAGHAVGSHGQHHTDPWRVRDATRWHGLATTARWLRPPYGHVTPGLLLYARRHDQHIALWDCMPADFNPDATPHSVTENVLRAIRPGSLIVLHDGPQMRGRIAPIVERLVPRLQQEGWTLAALPTQPGSPGGMG